MKLNTLKSLQIGLLLILLALSARAEEVVYISDVLRVGVRPEPDSRTSPVGVVITGMRLEVLERQDNYLRIKTDKGLTGWIKDIYVANDPPAMLQLEALQARQDTNKQQLEALQQELQVMQETNQSLSKQIDELRDERSKLLSQVEQVEPAPREHQPVESWTWWMIGLLVVAASAFTGGITWHRQQTIKRLGGLRF